MLGHRNNRARRGLTMIEVMVATVILSALVGMASYLVWSSAKTVSSAESALQSELQAREFLTNLSKELHQSQTPFVTPIEWTTMPDVTVAALKPTYPATPGAPAVKLASTFAPKSDGVYKLPPPIAGTGKYLPGVTPYYALRFRIPGGTMDLTTKHADVDKDPTAFNLASYKANGNNDADYNVEIQYWWEIERNISSNNASKSEGIAGPGAAGLVGDGIDNNNNGVIDEGVIKRMETVYTVSPTPTIVRRTVSIVVRDVAWDPFNNAPSLVFIVPNTDSTGTLYQVLPPPATAWDSLKRIFVSVTLEKADPQHPGKPVYNFKKTLSTYIDLRNEK